jgi:hypothetical protein
MNLKENSGKWLVRYAQKCISPDRPAPAPALLATIPELSGGNSELPYPAATLPVGIFSQEKSLLKDSHPDTPSPNLV